MIDTQVRSCCSSQGRLDTVRDVPKEPMKSRNVRVGEQLWKAALATADRDNENLADVIREFLAWYTRQPGARVPHRPERVQ